MSITIHPQGYRANLLDCKSFLGFHFNTCIDIRLKWSFHGSLCVKSNLTLSLTTLPYLSLHDTNTARMQRDHLEMYGSFSICSSFDLILITYSSDWAHTLLNQNNGHSMAVITTPLTSRCTGLQPCSCICSICSPSAACGIPALAASAINCMAFFWFFFTPAPSL